MKKIILASFACLLLLPSKVYSQWVEVTNPQNTTQNYGGIDVTVTAVNPSFNGGCEGTYWVANTGDSYTFTFNPAVSAVQFWCDAINSGEETAILVNGTLFPLNTCNLTEYINSCSPQSCSIINGVFVNNVSSLCGGLLTVYGNITTVTLLQQVGSSGTTFDLFIPPGVNIPAPSGDVVAGSNSPVTCGDSLRLTAVAAGATSFSWTGPNGFTSNQQNPVTQVNSLGQGQYIVTAQTSCGAVLDTVDVIVNPFLFAPVAGSNSPVCEGGVINLTTTGLNNATYSWTGPGGFTSTLQFPVINPADIADSGQYFIEVTVNNCTSLPGSTVVDVDPLPAIPGVAPINYCLDDVAVPLTATGNGIRWYTTATGGTALPGAPTPNTSVAGVTTYYASTTGPGPTNCESPRTPLVVTVYPHPVKPDIAYKNSYCSNETFIPFTVVTGQNVQYYTTATGGTPLQADPVVDPTVPGTYQWFATQTVNGCESDRFPITIIVHPYIEAAFTSTIQYGCTEDTVSLVNTSIGAFSYKWNFGDGMTDNVTVSPVHVYEDQGIYTIQLISTAPYCRDTFEQVIDLNHPLAASFTTDIDTICQHQAITFTNTSVTTTINGIAPTYTWKFGDGTTDANENTSHTYDVTGIYTVQLVVKDFVPCTSTAWKTVYVDTASALSLVSSDSMFCAGQAVSFTGNYSDIGLRGITYEYGDGITEYNSNPARHTYEQPGNYIIKLSLDYRVCRDTFAEIPIAVRPFPIINLGPDTSMCPTSGALVLQDLINGGNASATWLWNTGETTFNIPVTQPGHYSAAVTIDGCSAADSVWIKKDCYLDIPNSFTPNGDGLNDYFLPRQLLSESVKTFKMQIYNRWGQEIYSTTKIDGRGWDGRFNDEPQPQGVFIYMIEVSFANGTTEKKQGNVTLLR